MNNPATKAREEIAKRIGSAALELILQLPECNECFRRVLAKTESPLIWHTAKVISIRLHEQVNIPENYLDFDISENNLLFGTGLVQLAVEMSSQLEDWSDFDKAIEMEADLEKLVLRFEEQINDEQ